MNTASEADIVIGRRSTLMLRVFYKARYHMHKARDQMSTARFPLVRLLSRMRRSVRFRFSRKEIGIDIHAKARIDKSSTIEPGYGGRISIGRDTVLGPHTMLLAYGGQIVLGENCSVNPFCVLYGHGGLHIGNYVRIATHCVLVPANHVFEDPDTPIAQQGLTTKGIRIADDVWLGAGCRVLDGVVIGRGAVVGAGAVVTKDVAPMAIVAGVPARKIGIRGAAGLDWK
jgi:acetyltransferase-like isoleucine patch superfamily enzyme